LLLKGPYIFFIQLKVPILILTRKTHLQPLNTD